MFKILRYEILWEKPLVDCVPGKKKKSWEISVTRFHVLKMLSSEKGKRGAARFDM